MLRCGRRLLFVFRSECDVQRSDSVVRMKVIPNPVSSYTKLPASLKAKLGFVDAEAEKAEKEEKRRLVSELIRQGEGAKRTAGILLDRMRKEQAGKATDLAGPVSLAVIGATGEVRTVDTFVTFGSEKEEATPLGSLLQLGLRDMENLGVCFDYRNHHLDFVGDAPVKEEAAGTEEGEAEQDSDGRRKVGLADRKLAGSVLPGRDSFSHASPPVHSPDSPLAYDRT